ncbi:hypothetical protein MRX96_046950 [Rhipicephalus microplus]
MISSSWLSAIGDHTRTTSHIYTIFNLNLDFALGETEEWGFGRKAGEQRSPYIRTVACCQGGPNPLSSKSTDRIRSVPAQISRASSESAGKIACSVNLASGPALRWDVQLYVEALYVSSMSAALWSTLLHLA